MIDSGVENGAVGAPIFGLDVNDHASDGYVCVVPEQHSNGPRSLALEKRSPQPAAA
jgi:hypothetical protein